MSNENQHDESLEELFDETATDNTESDANDELEALRQQNMDLREQLKDSKDKTLRLSAELDNFRKRLTKETDDRLKYANQAFVENLLPVIDHLEMALNHTNPDAPADSLRQGVELTLKQFLSTVERFGVKPIKVEIGDAFDPNMHEAVMLDEQDNVRNDAITLVMQKGYTMHDRVIRPAKVKVNKNAS